MKEIDKLLGIVSNAPPEVKLQKYIDNKARYTQNETPIEMLLRLQKEVITLKQEMAQLRNYIQIQLKQYTIDITHDICKEFMNNQSKELSTALDNAIVAKLGKLSLVRGIKLREIQ